MLQRDFRRLDDRQDFHRWRGVPEWLLWTVGARPSLLGLHPRRNTERREYSNALRFLWTGQVDTMEKADWFWEGDPKTPTSRFRPPTTSVTMPNISLIEAHPTSSSRTSHSNTKHL